MKSVKYNSCINNSRITSYNVCYTKLLRCIPLYFKGKKERVEQICIENGIKVQYVNYSIYTDVASIDTERAIRITSYNVCYTKLLRMV